MMTKDQTRGVLLAMVTVVISGAAMFANSLVVKGIDPLVHNVVKNGLVGLVVVIIVLMRGEWRVSSKLSRRQWLMLALIALVGGSVSFWLFFAGVKMIGGVEGALIHKTLIFWAALLAIPLLKEKVSGKMWLAVILLYASNFAGGFKGFTSMGTGHLMVLAATLLWAIENVLAKKALSNVPVNVVVAARMFGGSLILAAMLIGSGKAPLLAALTMRQWLMLGGVAGLLFGYVMSWYRALKLLPVTLTASILVGATVITTSLDALLVKHSYSLNSLGQAILIVTGMYVALMAGMDLWQKGNEPKRKPVTI